MLRDGSFRCKDQHLLEIVEMLSQEFSAGSDYHPDPQLGLMNWICQQIGGTVTYYDEDTYKYPDDVCFSVV